MRAQTSEPVAAPPEGKERGSTARGTRLLPVDPGTGRGRRTVALNRRGAGPDRCPGRRTPRGQGARVRGRVTASGATRTGGATGTGATGATGAAKARKPREQATTEPREPGSRSQETRRPKSGQHSTQRALPTGARKARGRADQIVNVHEVAGMSLKMRPLSSQTGAISKNSSRFRRRAHQGDDLDRDGRRLGRLQLGDSSDGLRRGPEEVTRVEVAGWVATPALSDRGRVMLPFVAGGSALDAPHQPKSGRQELGKPRRPKSGHHWKTETLPTEVGCMPCRNKACLAQMRYLGLACSAPPEDVLCSVRRRALPRLKTCTAPSEDVLGVVPINS